MPQPARPGRIALRSYHGRFLCQEAPGHPTWAVQCWLGGIHRIVNGGLHIVADRHGCQEWEHWELEDAGPPEGQRCEGDEGSEGQGLWNLMLMACPGV